MTHEMRGKESRRVFLKRTAVMTVAAMAGGFAAAPKAEAESSAKKFNPAQCSEKIGAVKRVTHYGPNPETGAELSRQMGGAAPYIPHRRATPDNRNLIFLEGSHGAAVVRIERSTSTVLFV